MLAWLYLRRPAAFPRLRSALVLATAAANVAFWAWPAAPPRLSVPGMTDILVTRDILGAAHPRGAHQPGQPLRCHAQPARRLGRLVRRRGRLGHAQPMAPHGLVYPAATTFVVLASANHFVLDVAGGLAVAGLGILATSRPSRLLAHLLARPAGRSTATPRASGPHPAPAPGTADR